MGRGFWVAKAEETHEQDAAIVIMLLGIGLIALGVWMVMELPSASLNKFSADGRDTLGALAVLGIGAAVAYLGLHAWPGR